MGETITAITKLLLMIPLQSQERILIDELNNYHKFDHNIFLLDIFVDVNRFFNCPNLNADRPEWSSAADRPEYLPQSIRVFKSFSNNTISGLETLTIISSKNTFVIVAPKSVNYTENLQLLAHIKELQMLDVNLKIGVFLSGTVVFDDEIKKHLQWCWKHRIVNVFIAYHSINPSTFRRDFNIFRLNIFETFDVINVTGSESLKNLFPSTVLNFQRHPLRILDTNRLCDTNVWRAVSRTLNASLVGVPPEMLKNAFTRSDIYESGMDVAVELEIYRNYTGLKFLYPLKILSAVMVVPEALPYSKFTNYLLAVTNNEFFVTFSITILATTFVLSCCRYINERKWKFVQSTIDVLKIILVNDNGDVEYRRLCRSEVFVIVPLTFAGFLLVNVGLSTFQSHLTRPFNRPEINTIEDLYRSPYVIMTNDEALRIHAIQWLNSLSPHDEWTDKVHLMEFEEFFRQIFAYNISMSFPLELDRAKHLIKRQHQLRVCGYRIPPEIYLQKMFASYAICEDYPFVDRLNDIMHRIQGAGLYDKWYNEELQLWAKQIPFGRNNKTSVGSDMTNFGEVQSLEIIVYGWIAGCVVFAVEVLCGKFRLKRLQIILKRIH